VAEDIAALGREDRHPGALRHDLQLGDGVGALQVGGHEQRRVALILEPEPSLPARVVLPEPCRPTSMMTVGGSWRTGGAGLPAEDLDELLVDDLDDLLGRIEGLVDLGAECPLADRTDEALDDRQRHVGVEQRHADVAQRRVDVVLGQPTLAPEVAEGGGQPVRQRVEHRETLPVGPGG
jgi:hypothetical protein